MLIKYEPSSWLNFDPFAPTERQSSPGTFDLLRREMDRLFSGYERSFGAPFGPADAYPNFRVEDTGSDLVVTAEVPGLTEKDMELSVTGDTVSLRGERKVEAPQGFSTHRQERSAYHFTRAFRLPAPVDAERVEANLKNGILTVKLPKAAEARPRAIPVKAG